MLIQTDEANRIIQWSRTDFMNELLFDIPDSIVPDDFEENAFFYCYKDEKLIFDDEYKAQYEQEQKVAEIRYHREQKCFPVINRGEAWYRTLSDKQKEELQDWYQKWLDATETLIEPEPPEWLKRRTTIPMDVQTTEEALTVPVSTQVAYTGPKGDNGDPGRI